MLRRHFIKQLMTLGAGLGVSTASLAQTKTLQISPLAGFQYYQGADCWEQLAIGQPLTLRREPNNPHDAQAVAIDWQGRQLGYLSRLDNTAIAHLLDNGERLMADIHAMQTVDNPWERLAIRVRLAM